MARIRNNPTRYVTRKSKLPTIDPDVNTNELRVEERKQRFRDDPIEDNFYIDFRKPARS